MKRTAGWTLALALLAFSFASARGAGMVQRPDLEARWQAERAGMVKQVLDRARAHQRSIRSMVEIGTMAPIDVRESDRLLADLERMVDADTKRVRQGPTALDEIFNRRLRFAAALNDLDLAEVRFDNGMMTTANLGAAVMAAASVVLR
jgi:hypothetical protein